MPSQGLCTRRTRPGVLDDDLAARLPTNAGYF